MSTKDSVTELSEDMEVIGPGRMLADAREKLNLSQKDVAESLNFRISLVNDIENEIFDKSLPATYNRGYLKNYAKLVHVKTEDVIAGYELLSVAETHGAEMQSFSKITEKQTQNNILMWVSYLILALLIGSTAMWWFQDYQGQKSKPQQTPSIEASLNESNSPTTDVTDKIAANDTKLNISSEKLTSDENQGVEKLSNSQGITETSQPIPEPILTESIDDIAQDIQQEPILSEVIFYFSGDCWVNIFDAKGERIAWGVKKTGYEMKISALAPIRVTLGRPELVEISYQAQAIDMSQFNVGNIAKFTLPLTTNP